MEDMIAEGGHTFAVVPASCHVAEGRGGGDRARR